jgi:hypothetical protein
VRARYIVAIAWGFEEEDGSPMGTAGLSVRRRMRHAIGALLIRQDKNTNRRQLCPIVSPWQRKSSSNFEPFFSFPGSPKGSPLSFLSRAPPTGTAATTRHSYGTHSLLALYLLPVLTTDFFQFFFFECGAKATRTHTLRPLSSTTPRPLWSLPYNSPDFDGCSAYIS